MENTFLDFLFTKFFVILNCFEKAKQNINFSFNCIIYKRNKNFPFQVRTESWPCLSSWNASCWEKVRKPCPDVRQCFQSAMPLTGKGKTYFVAHFCFFIQFVKICGTKCFFNPFKAGCGPQVRQLPLPFYHLFIAVHFRTRQNWHLVYLFPRSG